MKIAFLNCTNGLVNRGVETFVHELANSLSKNHKVMVFQAGKPLENSRYKTMVISLDFKINKENGLRSLSKNLLHDFNFPNLLRRFYLDHWHLKEGEFVLKALKVLEKDTEVIIIAGSGWASLFCRLWTWFYRKKLVIAGQSGPGWDDRISLLCRPNVFVALSNHAKNWAEKAGPGVKTLVIPNGVDLTKFNPKVVPIKINLPKPIFICVAALEPGKRIDLTIKAIGKLRKGSLLVMGAGQSKDDLEKLGDGFLPGRFKIVSVKYADMPKYYAAADVVTMAPHGFESFGIIFVEAMACNKPVVAPDDPIRHEIIGKAGIFVDPEDIDDYANGLEKALEINWKNIPRFQAIKFSWDAIAKKYEELFLGFK